MANSKDELFAREGHHIRNTQCVNKKIMGQTREGHAELKRRYSQARLNKSVNCECGGHYSLDHKHHHVKTKRHLNFFAHEIPNEEVITITNCPCGGHYRFNKKYYHIKTKIHKEICRHIKRHINSKFINT